jgi:hypothetical protein
MLNITEDCIGKVYKDQGYYGSYLYARIVWVEPEIKNSLLKLIHKYILRLSKITESQPVHALRCDEKGNISCYTVLSHFNRDGTWSRYDWSIVPLDLIEEVLI